MPVAVTNAHLDTHLQRKLGVSGYSVSGATITVPSASVSAADLSELLRVAALARHEVSLAAGVLTIKPV